VIYFPDQRGNTNVVLSIPIHETGRIPMNRVREWREARGWSQAQLARLIGASQPQVDRLEKGDRRLTEQWLRRLSEALGVSIAELLDTPALTPGGEVEMNGKIPSPLVGDRDLPVFGATEGGRFGAMSVSDGPIQVVRRPEPLLRVAGGFGLYVAGESMEPAYRQGDIVLLHPSMPPRRGDDVVLVRVDEHNDRHALVKQLVDWSEDTWTVRQYNPAETFTLQRQDWSQVHVVVGRYNRR
jgi:phage repressor protein C with HTH and peptisase S24 domain